MQQLIIISKKGIIKRTPLEEIRKMNRGGTGLLAMGLKEDLIAAAEVAEISELEDIVILTCLGKVIRFSIKDIRPMGRQASGVKAISLSSGDSVIAMSIVKPCAGLHIEAEKVPEKSEKGSNDDFRTDVSSGPGTLEEEKDEEGEKEANERRETGF